MKTFSSLPLCALVLFLLTTSCSEKEHLESPNTPPAQIDGTWNLVEIDLFYAPVSIETGDHFWSIDSSAGVIQVTDMSSPPSPHVPESGTYSLSLTPDSLFLEGVGYRYSLEQGDLILEQGPELDGPRFRFVN